MFCDATRASSPHLLTLRLVVYGAPDPLLGTMTASGLLVWISLAVVTQLAIGITVAARRRGVGQAPTRLARAMPLAWPGVRAFRVDARVFEDPSHSQCSFHLVPVDGASLPSFRPGQFLTVVVPIAAPSVVIEDAAAFELESRCYSLSDAPRADGYRVTVKRARAPIGRPDLPAGVVSSYLHDRVTVGTTLQVRAPAGQFAIDPDPSTPIVLIGGGIGVTPLLSMLLWCLAEQPERPVTMLHGVRSSADHAFKSVERDLADRYPRLDLHVFYSEPDTSDVVGKDFTHRGVITLELIARIVPEGRHQYYVCGPAAMMEAIVPGLAAAGVADSDIHFEAFGPATVRRGRGAALVSHAPLDVQFRDSGRTLTWDGASTTLLDLAESNGISIPVGCRSGSCGTCETRLVSGTVAYATAPEFDISTGFCLPCVGVPQSAVVLDA
jgi:uncharacterized protein